MPSNWLSGIILRIIFYLTSGWPKLGGRWHISDHPVWQPNSLFIGTHASPLWGFVQSNARAVLTNGRKNLDQQEKRRHKKKLRLVASKGIYWFRKPQELNCGTDFHRPTSSHAFKITVRVSHPARLFAEECANWFSLLWPQVDQNPNPQHWWIFKWVWRLRTPTGDIIFPKGLYKRPPSLSASFIDYNDHNYVRYALACSSTYSRKSASARSHAYAVFTDFPSFSAGLCPDHFRLIPSTFFFFNENRISDFLRSRLAQVVKIHFGKKKNIKKIPESLMYPFRRIRW